jgi:colanic acid/amylovoran biosynthesis glycosyltransferase
MKIALLVPQFPKLSETFIVRKLLGLLDHGTDVFIVCNQSLREDWAHLPLAEQRVLKPRVIVTPRPRSLSRGILSAARLFFRCLTGNPLGTLRYVSQSSTTSLPRVLRQLYFDAELIALKPDIVHFEFGAIAVGRMHLKQVLGCRVIVSFRGHDLNFVGLDQPDFYSDVWRTADAVHLLGNDLWARAQKRGCPPSISHVLIPPAIDLQRFDCGSRLSEEVIGTNSRPARLLSVGRLHWTKGHEFVMSSVRILIDSGLSIQLRIVGGGDSLEAAAFCRRQLELEDVVTLVGPISPAQVIEEMADADVLVNGSVSEGFCNTVIEAQAMKLPVVASDAGGLPENVDDGVTGFVVPRRDPVAMANKLGLLIDDSALRQEMGKAGRKRVEALFRVDDQIRAFEKLYDDVLREATNDRILSSSN